MRNIFLFIRRYFNFLFFLLLQAFSLYFISHYSSYHQAAFGNVTNEFTGKINAQYSQINNYFHLQQTNDQLALANEISLNNKASNFQYQGNDNKLFSDSLVVDSVKKIRVYNFMRALVVSNSVASQNNFIVLSKGSNNKFHAGMGIVDPLNGVVGIITEVSENYAVVMSLLHRDSHISGKLLKSGETGTLSWDGKEPNVVTLSNISKSAKIAIGDTVITSGFSTAFPKGIFLGRVEAVYSETSSNNYKVKLHTAANFYNLEYVYGINNVQQDEVEKILEKVQKQM